MTNQERSLTLAGLRGGILSAALSMSLAATASAQCNILDQDFDAFAPGTPIDSLVGWSDLSPGQDVFLGTNPDNSTTALVFGDGSLTARRRIDTIGLGQRFQLSSEITVERDGNFRLQCPPVFEMGQAFMNFRVNIGFETTSTEPVIRYKFFATSTSVTLPLLIGIPTRLEVDVDTQGNVATYYNGQLLAVEAWATGGPLPCSTPQDIVWQSFGSGELAGMVVDNVCVGDPFATNYCAATANSTGVISRISALGTPSLSANDMTLTTTDLPSSQFGFYVLSTTQGFTANPGGSTGNLCLAGSIGRYPQTFNSGIEGTITMPVNWTSLPQPSGPVSATAGDTWNFQLWHRDFAGGSATSNLSEGLQVTVTP